jgi:glycosyltransferase involved in cell wall biosynthesis
VTQHRVTVIICAYTLARWEYLRASIESVLQQAFEPVDLVIVIDHNTELYELVRSAYPAQQVIENENPAGLSGARNSGLAVAIGDVVAFLDDDAAAAPGWLEALIDGYGDPAVQGVGGSIEPVWAAGRPGWFPPEFDWVVGCTYRGLPRDIAAVRNPIGANMSFRRHLFETIGTFREGLGRIGETPVGGEETELCIRAVLHHPGARFLYNPGAKVRHHVPAGRGTWRYFVRRCYAEGLSKAAIGRSVGRGAGLASERGYATRTLPAGVLDGVRDAMRGNAAGLLRAVAIITGLAVTTAGYVIGSMSARFDWTSSPVSRPAGLGPP